MNEQPGRHRGEPEDVPGDVPGDVPVTGIEESDPNADSAAGLGGGAEGGMGVSSERQGTVRGGDDEVTYGTAPTYTPDDDPGDDAPPEQSVGNN